MTSSLNITFPALFRSLSSQHLHQRALPLPLLPQPAIHFTIGWKGLWTPEAEVTAQSGCLIRLLLAQKITMKVKVHATEPEQLKTNTLSTDFADGVVFSASLSFGSVVLENWKACWGLHLLVGYFYIAFIIAFLQACKYVYNTFSHSFILKSKDSPSYSWGGTVVVVFTQLQNVRVKHNLSLLLNFLGPGAQSRIMEKKLHLHGVRLFHLCFFFSILAAWIWMKSEN